MSVNKLTLNFSKSNILLINHSSFNTRKVNSSYHTKWSTFFKIRGDVKYSSVMFDKNLFFDCHINKLGKNHQRAVGILAKAKPLLNTKALLLLYYDIFHSHIQYSITLWNSTYKTYLNKLSIFES